MRTSAQPVSEVNTRYREHAEIVDRANSGVQDHRNWQDQDEARGQRVPVLNSKAKYVFRVRPGTLRTFSVRIPTLPDDFKSDREREVRTERFAKRRELVDGKNPKFDLDYLREKVGGEWIIFKNIPGGPDRQGSSFYETSDDEVYAFLMHRKKVDTSGAWANIFVEYPSRIQKINGIEVPGTIAGFEAAQNAFMADQESPQEN